jgi:hypothetical protein
MQASIQEFPQHPSPQPETNAPHESPEGAVPGLNVSRADLARAIHHWGCSGHGGEPGLKLTREADTLVEVLAIMDFEHQTSVLLPPSSRPGLLVMQALESTDQDKRPAATMSRG